MDSAIIAALIGASATIGAAWIMTRPGKTTDNNPPPPVGDLILVNPAHFTVHGEVIRTIGKDLGIRVRNDKELRQFWRDHQIDTDIDWFDQGRPVYSIGRQEDVARSKPGQQASLTFKVQDRSNGKRGVRTVDFKIL